MDKYRFENIIHDLISTAPLVHVITNSVAIKASADALLFIGASPIASDFSEDAAEISSHADALCANLGMLNRDRLKAILSSCDTAKAVLLDPVGVGISSFRKSAAFEILSKGNVRLIRGNLSEIKALLGISDSGRGVDSSASDLSRAGEYAEETAGKFNTAVFISGETDFVSDGKTTLKIIGGHEDMTKISGSGCVLSAVTAAFLPLADKYGICDTAAVSAAIYSYSGEKAHEKALGNGEYLSSMGVYLLDNLGISVKSIPDISERIKSV